MLRVAVVLAALCCLAGCGNLMDSLTNSFRGRPATKAYYSQRHVSTRKPLPQSSVDESYVRRDSVEVQWARRAFEAGERLGEWLDKRSRSGQESSTVDRWKLLLELAYANHVTDNKDIVAKRIDGRDIRKLIFAAGDGLFVITWVYWQGETEPFGCRIESLPPYWTVVLKGGLVVANVINEDQGPAVARIGFLNDDPFASQVVAP